MAFPSETEITCQRHFRCFQKSSGKQVSDKDWNLVFRQWRRVCGITKLYVVSGYLASYVSTSYSRAQWAIREEASSYSGNGHVVDVYGIRSEAVLALRVCCCCISHKPITNTGFEASISVSDIVWHQSQLRQTPSVWMFLLSMAPTLQPA